MIFFILGALSAIAALLVWTLQRTYAHVPARELKRLARAGDDISALLFRPVAYGVSLEALLKLCGVVLLALALVCFVKAVGVWLAVGILLVGGALGGLVLVPAGELNRASLWLAKRLAPFIAWLLEHLHPLFEYASQFIRHHRPNRAHTGLYEKADLMGLLEAQKSQTDSRITPAEIELLQHSLSFGDRTVATVLAPKRAVKLVAANDSVGPVLMDELTRSGYNRFPVYDGKRDNIVGILYLRDLVGAKHTGMVRDLMETKLTYVHEDFMLMQVLQAFLKTKQHLFLVVNSFEEFVGIITIEDVLEQMIGQAIVDEFDAFDDLRAVVAEATRKEHHEHTEPNPQTTPEAQEVVE